MRSRILRFITLSRRKYRQTRPKYDYLVTPTQTTQGNFAVAHLNFSLAHGKIKTNLCFQNLGNGHAKPHEKFHHSILTQKADQKYDLLVTPTQTNSRHFGAVFAVALLNFSQVHGELKKTLCFQNLGNGHEKPHAKFHHSILTQRPSMSTKCCAVLCVCFCLLVWCAENKMCDAHFNPAKKPRCYLSAYTLRTHLLLVEFDGFSLKIN